ncbi:MAG: SRPBCC domain-containing protein [Exilibacterium sp.]
MKKANSEVVIKASAERVWSVVSAFDKYPEWNPFLLSITGNLREGEPLSVKVKMQDKTNLFKVRVTRVSAGREFRWQTGWKGLLRSEHYFSVRKINESKVSFRQGEIFWGVFSFIIGHGLLEQAASNFERMNEALKQRAEAALPPIGN